MSALAALNHSQRCVQELSDFDCAMGWAFQKLTVHENDEQEEDAVNSTHRERKRREHTHTALDEPVEIPIDFVAPSIAHTTKPKKPTVRSAKATKPPTAFRNTTTNRRRPSASRDEPPVDFVYDVNVRRAIRDRMDKERFETLQSRDPPSRKHAWGVARPRKPPPPKTAIAHNISEWRTQETPFHSSIETQRAQRKRQQQQHRYQQECEANEMRQSLNAFETQWGS